MRLRTQSKHNRYSAVFKYFMKSLVHARLKTPVHWQNSRTVSELYERVVFVNPRGPK